MPHALPDQPLVQMSQDALLQSELSSIAAKRHAERAMKTSAETAEALKSQTSAIADAAKGLTSLAALTQAWTEYMTDAVQRATLATDTLRKRADIFLDHQAKGAPPVLIYDYEIALDAANLDRPCNYILLKILAPDGVEIHDWKRPYVIIDPRAGHGAGIGGFKPDSQVGVALKDGHPVYFVAFRPDPVPGQTLADVTHAEAAFLREVTRLHPDSPKPIVVGNCQGGWATAILAATHPDLTGPIVLNGAPMSYWGGKLGQDPMRYSGGLAGGVTPAIYSSDMGGGIFDGANLVSNFESLNPGRTWFRKYYDLFDNADTAEERFLEFERWWGGFYMMTREEIRWIVENLFVGNKLGKNEAFIEPGRHIDLKAIRAPIICFASHGDNITPPAQALNWIADTYTDEREIEIRGQRILYMIHEQVGHLGIFVSSSVAKKEHSQMASTLKTIQALPPGLYEMMIEDHQGHGTEKTFTVSFAKRHMDDLLAATGGRRDEAAFAGVARLSETLAEAYDATLSPLLRGAVPAEMGALSRAAHPMRTSRAALSSANPAMAQMEELAATARSNRETVDPANPFRLAEKMWADMVEAGWNGLRDSREAAMEMAFLSIWANPLALWYGTPHAHTRAKKNPRDLRSLPEVTAALTHLSTGGLAEAIVRMLILLADSRADVRNDRLERSNEVLTTHAPFDAMPLEDRAAMIHEQGLIAHFEPQAALDTLPQLLPSDEGRKKALNTVEYVLGDVDDMAPGTRAVLDKMQTLLTNKDS